MASQRSFLPDGDQNLLAWSVQFKTKLSASPITYGMSAAQATAYSTLHNLFATALGVATDPNTRTKGTVAAKDDARTNLKELARSYAKMIVANTTVTTQQKLDMGLKPRVIPQPIPAPTVAPGMTINGVTGRTVKVSIFDPTKINKKGRPKGTASAVVMSYVGAVAPTDPTLYRYEGCTTKRDFEVQFPASVPAGATVFICAFWLSPTAMSGPACLPQQATLQYGMGLTTAGLKMAA